MVMIVLALATPLFAQTRPVTGVEAQAVVRAKPTAVTTSADAVNWQRLFTAMVVVLVLIVVLRYAAGWLVPGALRGGGGRGVRVLGRTPIAPRQQVLLLHVGRRVLVVGDSGGRLASLATIDDADEVAEMLGQVSQAPPAGAANRFKAMFGRATDPYVPPDRAEAESLTAEDDPDQQSNDPNVVAAQSEISGLLDRMRTLSKTVKR